MTWFLIGLLAIAVVIYFIFNNSRAIVRNTNGTNLKNVAAPIIFDDDVEKAKMQGRVTEYKAEDVQVSDRKEDEHHEEHKNE